MVSASDETLLLSMDAEIHAQSRLHFFIPTESGMTDEGSVSHGFNIYFRFEVHIDICCCFGVVSILSTLYNIILLPDSSLGKQQYPKGPVSLDNTVASTLRSSTLRHLLVSRSSEHQSRPWQSMWHNEIGGRTAGTPMHKHTCVDDYIRAGIADLCQSASLRFEGRSSRRCADSVLDGSGRVESRAHDTLVGGNVNKDTHQPLSEPCRSFLTTNYRYSFLRSPRPRASRRFSIDSGDHPD